MKVDPYRCCDCLFATSKHIARCPICGSTAIEDVANAETACSALVDNIAYAFRGIDRDNGTTLHEADLIDSAGTLNVDRSSDEYRAARELDRERSWNEVPNHVIEELYSVLRFLDAPGFRFYIPAYMSWTLAHHRTSDSPSAHSTIVALNPGSEPTEWNWNYTRFRLFDERQRATIVQFLEYMSRHSCDFDRDAASESLINWNAYLVERSH